MNSETLTRWYKEGDYYFLSDNTELRAIRPWKHPDSWAGKPWHGWFVGLSRTRDSDALTRSNFECFLKALRELPEVLVDDSENAEQSYRTEREDWSAVNSVFIVPESHWACGWIDWIAIHPSNEAALKLADEMLCSLSDYPILDEDHFSELEADEIYDWWQKEPLRYRVEICKDCGESIFAARHNEPTEKVFDWLRDTWA